MCLYPRLAKNKRYTPTKKNGGIVPHCDDKRKLAITISCGKCEECLRQKKREWQVRLTEEIKNNKNAKFVTLTFNEQELDKLIIETNDGEANIIAALAVKRFRERWRKENKISIRHWLVSELGHKNTERLHLHGIIWTEKDNDYIKKIWKYGEIWIGKYVNLKTINYIVKYITKLDHDHKGFMGKVFTSKGIGKGFTDKISTQRQKYIPGETIEEYRLDNGQKIAMPQYYRQKLYNDEEREKLWIEKLNKKIRYINGQKIDISNGEQEYYRALLYAQQQNERKKYGSPKWRKQEYKASRKQYNLEITSDNNI